MGEVRQGAQRREVRTEHLGLYPRHDTTRPNTTRHDTRDRWSVQAGNARTREKGHYLYNALEGQNLCLVPLLLLRVARVVHHPARAGKHATLGTTHTTRTRVCETYMMTDLPPSLPSSVSIRFLPADADKLRISFISGNKICSTGSQLVMRTCVCVCVCVCGVALRCVALRCVALRCVALRCVALRCVACAVPER